MRVYMLAGFLLIAGAAARGQPGYEVKWVGEMRRVMMMGEDKGIVSLDSVEALPHLYALGPVEGLNGEITVFNGEASVASIRGGKPVVEKTFQVRAPLLVYVQVAKWSEVAIPAFVRDIVGVARFVEQSAKSAGLDMTKPNPFRITGQMDSIGLHIVNRQGREAKGMAEHEKIEVKVPLRHADLELLGFWSDRHQGVFTHMGSNVHIHGRTTDNRISGHVDEFRIASAHLWLPAAGE